MDFALYEGREQIAKSTEKLMQEMLDRYRPACYVQKVTLQNVQPPDKVQAAFDDAVKAGQDRERFKNEGQAYANDVVPRARGNASRLLEEANGYQAEVVAAGRGRRLALPPDPGRVREGARRHARAPLPRHDAVGARQLEQGAGRPEGRQQPALPAARQADPAERAAAAAGDAGGRDAVAARGHAAGARARRPRLDPRRSREALRSRERGG